MSSLSLLSPAWHRSDSADALQRARLRLAPLAERAISRAGAHCPAIEAWRDEWRGHNAASLGLLAAQLSGYVDALEDVAAAMPRAMQWRTIDEMQRDAARYTRARRAWRLVSGLAELARRQERGAALVGVAP